MNGQPAHFMLADEHLLLRPETNLHPRITDTVRTIVAKHLPEDTEPLPKRNWMQRWFTNPEPQELSGDWKYEPEDYYGEVETPYADTLISRLNEAHLDAIAKERKQAAQDGVFVAVHHLEKHLASLSNETMIDTVVHSATQDCIEVLRNLHRKMGE